MLAPEHEGRGAAGAQRLTNVLRLARVEVACSADQAQPALLAFVRRQHLAQDAALREAPCEHREEPASGDRVPRLDAGDSFHRPLACVNPVEHRDGAHALGRAGHHELRGGRTHVVRHHRRARDTE